MEHLIDLLPMVLPSWLIYFYLEPQKIGLRGMVGKKKTHTHKFFVLSSQEADCDFHETTVAFGSAGCSEIPVSTGTPYPVRSSLSLGESFIFFLLGSSELLFARTVEKKDISDGQ